MSGKFCITCGLDLVILSCVTIEIWDVGNMQHSKMGLRVAQGNEVKKINNVIPNRQSLKTMYIKLNWSCEMFCLFILHNNNAIIR